MAPEPRLRVLIDTNVLVSAVVCGGVPERVLDMARTGSVTGVVSLHILAELREVLMRPRFGVDVSVADALAEQIAAFCDVVAVERATRTWSADPDDDPVIEAAARGRADILVTGDRHLFALTIPGLRIARPAEMVDLLEENPMPTAAPITIRVAAPVDLPALLEVERAAFSGPVEAELTAALIAGTGFVPRLNLIALDGTVLVGHILFTRARVGDVDAALLAPLAVVPDRQRQGVGTALVARGLEVARALGFSLALVLGHPEYYPRFGFQPALPLGIEAPYPIDPSEAWMALELVPGAFHRAAGVVEVAEDLRAPELWRE